MKLKFCPTTIFRETPKVTFFDAGIDSTNGCDVVMHSGEAISPPDQFDDCARNTVHVQIHLEGI